MNKKFMRLMSLLLAMLMLVSVFGLVACNQPEGPNDETTPGDTPSDTTPGGSTDVEPTKTWLNEGINEKIAALSNYFGRNMSVALGGNIKDYPMGSMEAIESAIESGADAIGLYVHVTKDNVLVALPGETLAESTDISAKLKQDSTLPKFYSANKWTYEQLQVLSLLNADESVSDKKIAKFEDVVKACAGKCFIYVMNDSAFKNNGEAIYNIAKANNAFSSFMVTPGVEGLVEWKNTYKDDAALADFVNTVCEPFHKINLYFDIRKPFDHTVNKKSEGWEKATDDAAGWEKATKAKKTFLITKDIVGYTKWIMDNSRSALEYQPTNWDSLEYSLKKEDLTARYLLISDIHYAPVEFSGYINRVHFRGHDTDERMRNMCDNIRAEYQQRGLDAIFVLGDLSTDDYPIRYTSGVWLKTVWDNYLKPLSNELGIPVLPVAGNHDSYPAKEWEYIFGGIKREYVWENEKNGDVFIMCDTFNTAGGNTATGGGGANFTNINKPWVMQQLEKYKDRKNVFLASHYFGREETTNSLAELVDKYPNVRALFDGHSHSYVSDSPLLGATGRRIINTGNYSYGGTQYVFKNGVKYYNFNYHDTKNPWGYNLIETTATTALSYRIDVDQYYSGEIYSTPGEDGGTFTYVKEYVPYKKYNDIVFYSAT